MALPRRAGETVLRYITEAPFANLPAEVAALEEKKGPGGRDRRRPREDQRCGAGEGRPGRRAAQRQ
eukprot:1547059-Lingulodinium_polyedra.AAC.1